MNKEQEQIRKKIYALTKAYFDEMRHDFIPGKTKIGVGYPVIDDKEVNRAIESLLDIRVSQGKSVKIFEEMFAKYLGVKHAIAVNSGSSANLLALAVLTENGDVKKGSEIIVPAATFATVASPIIQLGLVPLYVDVNSKTYNIDPNEIEKAISDKTSVLMPVHSLGHPAEMDKIMSIAEKYNLKVLEDCCEAHGSLYKGKKVGSFGDLATLSFFVAHNITTGEGGMIFTNNNKYEELARSLREFGRISQKENSEERFSYSDPNLGIYDRKYVFERIGFNVRMTDIEASLGIEQLKKLDKLNSIRREVVSFYNKKLKPYQNLIQLPYEASNVLHTYYTYQLVIKKGAPFTRIEITNYLEENNIETRPFFAGSLPDQPGFINQPKRVIGELPVTRWLRDNAFFIGCHAIIGKDERQFVTDKIIEFLERY